VNSDIVILLVETINVNKMNEKIIQIVLMIVNVAIEYVIMVSGDLVHKIVFVMMIILVILYNEKTKQDVE